MRLKCSLHKLWNFDLEWDKDFSNDTALTSEWRSLLLDCDIAIQNVSMPRWLKVNQDTGKHVFCDASATSYGACIYILNPSPNPDNQGECKLVFAKIKH